MGGKYRLTTLGCKVNQYESQQVRDLLEHSGWRPAREGETADLTVVNTCVVTAGASRKNRQAIRREARNGHSSVVVIGCGATEDADRLRRLEGVSAVLGHDVDVSTELRGILAQRQGSEATPQSGATPTSIQGDQRRPQVIRYDESMNPGTALRQTAASTTSGTSDLSERIMGPVSGDVKLGGELTGTIQSFSGRQRALLKVQDGCDGGCSYCIVPRVRRKLRSKPLDLAVAEVEELVRHGHREIVVSGVYLGAYGRGTAHRKRWSPGPSPLAGLVAALAGIPGLERLRLSSLEPGDVDESLLERLASDPVCVPHFHLPLQSGSPEVLRRMNRQYTPQAFVDVIERLRASLDRPAITTDVIVGFPGETEEDFEATLRIAHVAEFCKIHAFPFSARPKTAAARWTDSFIPPPVIRERMSRLAAVEQACSLAYRERFVGEIERIIVEEAHNEGENGGVSIRLIKGRTDRYFPVMVKDRDAQPGDVVHVRIDRVTPTETLGTRAVSHTTTSHINRTKSAVQV